MIQPCLWELFRTIPVGLPIWAREPFSAVLLPRLLVSFSKCHFMCFVFSSIISSIIISQYMRPPVDCAIWSTPFQTSDNAATVFAKYTLNSPLPPLLLCSFLYPVHWRHQTEIVVVLILAQGSDYLVQRVFNTIEHIFTIEHILAIFNLKRQLSTGKLKKAPICWRCCSMNSVRIENLWRFSKLCPIVSKLCPSQTFTNFIQFSPSSAPRLSRQLFNITNNQIRDVSPPKKRENVGIFSQKKRFFMAPLNQFTFSSTPSLSLCSQTRHCSLSQNLTKLFILEFH